MVVEADWAELKGEGGSLHLMFGPQLGQSRPGRLTLRIGELAVQDSRIDFTEIESFEFGIRSLADHRVGTAALLSDLYGDFDLEVQRVGSETYSASLKLRSRHAVNFELSGSFYVDNIDLQKFASGLRRLLEKLIK